MEMHAIMQSAIEVRPEFILFITHTVWQGIIWKDDWIRRFHQNSGFQTTFLRLLCATDQQFGWEWTLNTLSFSEWTLNTHSGWQWAEHQQGQSCLIRTSRDAAFISLNPWNLQLPSATCQSPVTISCFKWAKPGQDKNAILLLQTDIVVYLMLWRSAGEIA